MEKKYSSQEAGMKTMIKMNNMGTLHVAITKKKHRSIITIIREFITRKKTT